MNPVMRRLMREYKELSGNPVREFRAMPLEDNMFEWHFTILGPEDSPYAEGLYHGRVLIPTNYPFAPPDVVLITPNGRFELEKKICLSISSYHPENWRSNWGVSTVLHALRQFMLTPGNSGIGAIEYPAETRKAMAKDSRDFKCAQCGRTCAEDWEMMKASPAATEADLTASVPPTPMMTPQNSMGTPQSSLVNNNNTSPSLKPSAAATASDDSNQTTPPPPTVSPLSVGQPAVPNANQTPPSKSPIQLQQQPNTAESNNNISNSNNATSSSTSFPASPLPSSTDEDTKAKEIHSNNNNNNNKNDDDDQQQQEVKERKSNDDLTMKRKESNVEEPAAAIASKEQEQKQEQPQTTIQQPANAANNNNNNNNNNNFNGVQVDLPPPMNNRQRRVAQQQQQGLLRHPRRGAIPQIRRDANGRLEIQFSLELLDKLIAFTALILGMLITYKMAVSIADPETVAGRVFDSVVQAGLDLVE